MRGRIIAGLLAAALLGAAPARAEEPLQLETRITLPDIIGRLDGLALDAAQHRLFVAEIGNDSVAILDLAAQKFLRRLMHLEEPRGLGYLAASDTLYVASGLDGALRSFRGPKLAALAAIALGPEPDEIRIDAAARLVYVGYGAGVIATIDDATHQIRGKVTLREHPAGFALAPDGKRLFVDIPATHEIAVIEPGADKPVATWPLADGRDNFPLALDGDRVLSVFRRPPLLAALSAANGHTLATAPTCGDAGGVFVDARRRRVYVICGEGFVDVLEREGAGYRRTAHLATGAGARTGLFSAELDRLFVAVPTTPASAVTDASPAIPAAVWVFRPAP